MATAPARNADLGTASGTGADLAAILSLLSVGGFELGARLTRANFSPKRGATAVGWLVGGRRARGLQKERRSNGLQRQS